MRLANKQLLFPALLCLTIVVYWGGLDSHFILDDFYNLQGLSEVDKHGYLYYIFTNGFAGAGGRPISLLSFAVQHSSWPDFPIDFKIINLIIHLINGLLIYGISGYIWRLTGQKKENAFLFQIIVAGLWLLHPIQTNTVLYTVQRMTQLSAFFCFLGMLAYIKARTKYEVPPLRCAIFIYLSVFGCTLLAVLSKENGILLPLFIMLFEWLIFTGRQKQPAIRKHVFIATGLPIVTFLGYLFLKREGLIQAFDIRVFTAGERVMTEFVVLMDYIRHILLPRPSTFSLFHDNYPVSTGMLEPGTTLMALVLLASLIIISLYYKKKYVIPAFGMLFFLTGHVLEAGPLSLNLYFEHRNYLPSMGIMLIPGFIVANGWQHNKFKISKLLFITFYLILLTGITYEQARLWSNSLNHLTVWSQNNPGSNSAQNALATEYVRLHDFENAEEILNGLAANNKNDIYPLIRLFHVQSCYTQNIDRATATANALLDRSVKELNYNLASLSAFDILLLDITNGNCPQVDTELLEDIFTILINNPDSNLDKGILYELLSTLTFFQGDITASFSILRKSISTRFDIETRLREIYLLEMLGRFEERQDAVIRLEQDLATKPILLAAIKNRLSVFKENTN